MQPPHYFCKVFVQILAKTWLFINKLQLLNNLKAPIKLYQIVEQSFMLCS